MTAQLNSVCPGCGSFELSKALVLENEPVILNYRFSTPQESAAVPKKTITLRGCKQCELIFNSTFDPEVVPYDERYENRQSHSAAFSKHTRQVAKIISAMLPSEHPRILEVGCGKGEFLLQLVKYSSGEGEGWDTSYEGPPQTGNVTFHKSYLTPEASLGHFDAIVCRHVIEHVAEIGNFLKNLAAISSTANCPYIFLETPRLEWILEHKSAWDIFYEHCNYFSEASLAYLCRTSGFKVLGQYPVFDGQYQLLVLAHGVRKCSLGEALEFEKVEGFLTHSISHLGEMIRKSSKGGPWAIWGAGAKGICLANRLNDTALRRVFDTNPAKQGFFVPGTHIPIVDPSDENFRDLRLIVIANPNYEAEIREHLKSSSYRESILVLSEKLP